VDDPKTSVSAVPGAHARRPLGSGDAWVELSDGRRFWGTFGAAGLLLVSPAGVLLQKRAGYSHFGGTWGLPGGARHEDESAVQGAIREAGEEAGVPEGGLRVRFTSRLELPPWHYTTVVASTSEAFVPVIGDAESDELAWVPIAEVAALDLHPGLADSWPRLRPALAARPVLVVDAANVVGSRPDGWWKDRPAATERLADRLARLVTEGVPAGDLHLPHTHWWPSVRLVLEGTAREASAERSGLIIERAHEDADSAILDYLGGEPAPDAVLATADRALAAEAERRGATILSPSRLWELLDAL
jgi:8-oxo-dGTP pyrophosphatase MutT (NUDIX family)